MTHSMASQVLFLLMNAPDNVPIDAEDVELMMAAWLKKRGLLDDSSRIKEMVDNVNRMDVTLEHCAMAVCRYFDEDFDKEAFDFAQYLYRII